MTVTPTLRTVTFGPVQIRYDDRVLTPRPWTLLQSRWAAELAVDLPEGPLLELCAGAGQIGLAAAVLSDRDLVQVDANPAATALARDNATAAGWAGRVDVRTGRIDEAVRPEERFPLVLADPPYLPTSQIGRWPEDPRAAIDGGADGLALIRTCLTVAATHLLPGGALLLQVAGPAQNHAVRSILAGQPELGLAHRAVRAHDDERAVSWVSRAD